MIDHKLWKTLVPPFSRNILILGYIRERGGSFDF